MTRVWSKVDDYIFFQSDILKMPMVLLKPSEGGDLSFTMCFWLLLVMTATLPSLSFNPVLPTHLMLT